MTTATLSLGKVQKKIQTKIDSIDMAIVNWKVVCFAGIFMCLALLIFYVLQITDLTRGSYSLTNYEKQISQLSDQNKNLEISFAENSFMDSALIKIQALNFQKATSIKYIQILDDSAKTVPVNKNI